MKRYITGILLLMTLVAPAALTYCWLHGLKAECKHRIKRQMIAGIDREELVLLTFSREDATSKLKWEHAREFEYDGQMYDVVETEISGDSIRYWCWWDHEETRLNKQLAGLLESTFGQDRQKEEKQDYLITFFKNLYFGPPAQDVHPLQHAAGDELPTCPDRYNSLKFPPPTPPPQLV